MFSNRVDRSFELLRLPFSVRYRSSARYVCQSVASASDEARIAEGVFRYHEGLLHPYHLVTLGGP